MGVYVEDRMAMVEHICLSCEHQHTCHLWDQVMNIDEDFVRESFDYDPSVHSVCTTVSYCREYKKTWD